MKKFIKQSSPFVVPTTDNKLIEEHFGMASTGNSAFSVAHMVAPPFWSEPYQTPLFDEITMMVKGKKQIEIDGETVILSAGDIQTILSMNKYVNFVSDEHLHICISNLHNMKKYTIHLTREYIVDINAENEKAAREFTELYVSGGEDDSKNSVRIKDRFNIEHIKPILNEAWLIKDWNNSVD